MDQISKTGMFIYLGRVYQHYYQSVAADLKMRVIMKTVDVRLLSY